MNHADDPSASAMPLAFEGRRKLTTIMFSDICSYTAMMGKSESMTMRAVQRNLEIHLELLKKYHGRLIKELGDGLLSSFDSPSEAVQCAKELLDQIQQEEFNLHIGIHQGEVVFTENDVYGEGVNIAARIDSEAQTGEILVSEEVWKNIRNKEEFAAVSIGRKHLKNVDGTLRLFRIALDAETKRDLYKNLLQRRKGDMVKYGILILLPVLLLVALFTWYDDFFMVSPKTYQTIAVLPFENQTGNTNYEYMSEGLAEDVISQFFDLSAFAVISSRSSFQFKETDKTIQQLSRVLKADVILAGSFSFVGEELELTMELIEGETNEILSYASWRANMDDVKTLSVNVRREVTETLNVPSPKQNNRNVKYLAAVNAEAYKYYTLGKNAMRDNTQQSIDQLIQYFTRAIELDSTYADAYIGIAEAYVFDINRGYMSPTEAITRVRKYIMTAERLAPGSGEVHGILGILYCWEYNFRQAITHFERSIQISPNYDLTYQWYAYALAMQGQIEKGLPLFDKAIVLDPLNMMHPVLKSIHLTFQGDFIGAQQLLDGYLELNPGHPQTLWALGVLHLEEKDYQAAYDAFLKRNIGMQSNFVVGYAYAMLGMEAEALTVLNKVLENSKTKYVPPAQLAILYVGLGQYDKALDQVEQAYLVHDTWFLWIKYSNMLDPIRDHPRFITVMDLFDQ